ncbi:hypothetical protein WCLP8_420001 [uncultured Gammaproteobacteria bacterium]
MNSQHTIKMVETASRRLLDIFSSIIFPNRLRQPKLDRPLIDNAKRLGLDAARIDEERLQAQRKILEKSETAYRSSIDKLIAEEKRHRDAALNAAVISDGTFLPSATRALPWTPFLK